MVKNIYIYDGLSKEANFKKTMYISITSIRLRSLWQFFHLSYLGMNIVKQIRKEKGFLKMKNTGFGYLHYTITSWESEEDLKRFYKTGAHLKSMGESANLATEIGTYTYQSDQFPDWKEAKSLLQEKGKILTFGERVKA
jgi:hypothetical protein